MLKIKDNVDLKELEKFGFNVVDDDYIWNEEANISIDRYSRKIYVYGEDDKEDYQDLGVLYDLIKADLVEKVDESK